MFRKYLAPAVAILLVSCATVKPDYNKKAKNWQAETQLPTGKVNYNLFLIGDVGKPHSKIGQRTLALLKSKLDETQGRQGVIYLGDNVYPSGIPNKKAKNHDEEVEKMLGQIRILKNYEGDVYFIAGNHDWVNGRNSLKQEDNIVEEYLNRNHVFLPHWGCSGPSKVKLTDDVVMIMIDSQWYLENWDEKENFNKGCPSMSRTEFIAQLDNEIRKNLDKTIVLAMHHPIYSYGPHGGEFSFAHEIFPMTELSPYAYLPMPYIGGLLRKHLGVKQDLAHPQYVKFIREIKRITRGRDNIVFAAGHEHTLQYIEDEKHPFIVSGAGSKKSAASAGGFAQYTSGQGGFVELKFFDDGSTWAYFWNSKSGNLDYVKEVFQAKTTKDFKYPIYEKGLDSISASIYRPDEYPSRTSRWLWGPLNRELYYDSIKVPVLDLAKLPGNPKPIRKGGGNQTNSLRFEDESGKQFVMRSMRKDGTRILSGAFSGTVLVPILEDVFTYVNPFGAFILPELADSANIYHTNPKLVFVPRQPILGKYNESFGDDLYLIEERPANDGGEIRSFGYSRKMINSTDAMDLMTASHENLIDENWLIRSRIFDLMVGDWDRHQDNWRWATFPNDTTGGITLRPIPRDRDQVFSNFTGFIIPIINHTIPTIRQFQNYEEEIPWVKWYAEYAKYYDRRFVSPIAWAKWEKEIKYIQEHVNDALIERAVRTMPQQAVEYKGERNIEVMKARKKNLMKIAREFYELIALSVDILGTDKKDYFEVNRLDDERTEVIHWFSKKKKRKRYHRIFYTSETKEIRIYGMGGDDHFDIKGEVSKGIKIRVIGGYGDDKLKDKSKVKGWSKKTIMHDYPGGMKYEVGRETLNKISARYNNNNYEFRDFNRNYALIFPLVNYNIDFGFTAGVNFVHYDYGYKRRPKANVQRMSLDYAFGNQSTQFEYEGRFNNVFGYWGITTGALYRGSRFTVNYFGEGNESPDFSSRSILFNQVRQREMTATIGIRRPLIGQSGYFEVQPFYSNFSTERSRNRFISEINLSDLNEDGRFDNIEQTGLSMTFNYDTRDLPIAPKKGMLVNFNIKNSIDLNTDRDIAAFNGELSFFEPLDHGGKWVWYTSLGTQHVVGDYYFFQSAFVGGPNSLRGYREGRYRGRTAFWNSNDLRYDFGGVKNKIVPFRLGLFASLDHGRVWHDDLESKVWHVSAGGGMFLNILNMAAVYASIHRASDDEGLFLMSVKVDL